MVSASHLRWFALCAALAASACSSGPRPGEGPGGPGGGPGQSMKPVFSPNAEPLGRAVCTDALTAWFLRTDANRDGQISEQEFLADSAHQFARMDLDNDGFITSDELMELRRPFLVDEAAPERQGQGGPGGGPGGGSGGGGPGGGSGGPPGGGRGGPGGGMGGPGGGMGGPGGGSGGNGGPSGQQRGVSTGVDPVMSADENLDFKVSPAEFEARARQVFATADKNGDHMLGVEEITASCPASDQAKPERK